MPRPSAAKGSPAINSESLLPVYALDGSEKILVEETLTQILDASLPPASRDFNLDRLDGKGLSSVKIVETANLLPAFADRRVVVVRAADRIRAEEHERLLGYVENPSPTTVLILVADKFDARTKLYKVLKKHGSALRFDPLKPREMPLALKKRAKALGLSLNAEAARALADAVGTDLSRGVGALDLIALYLGSHDTEVTREVVAEVVSVTKEESVFQLSDAVGQQDQATALRVLHRIFRVSREHPLRVLSVLARHYRHLLIAKTALLQKKSRQEIQREVSVPAFLLPNLLEQAERSTVLGLANGLKKMAETDRMLKGGSLEGHRAMELLLLSLIRGQSFYEARRA